MLRVVIPGETVGWSLPFAKRSPAAQPRVRGLLSTLRRRLSWRLLFSASLCVLCVSALSSPAFAQSCALCYESARASANPAAINRGILVLLVPTLLLFAGIFIFTVRRSNSQQ